MSNRIKNGIIIFLLVIIAGLAWIVYDLSYGRYCRPIIREKDFPQELRFFDSLKIKQPLPDSNK